jgi:hypothetical protein
MVDRDLLLRKLANLDEYVQQVSEFSHTTVEQYRADRFQHAALRWLRPSVAPGEA